MRTRSSTYETCQTPSASSMGNLEEKVGRGAREVHDPRIPALQQIFHWLERLPEGQELDEATLHFAVCPSMTAHQAGRLDRAIYQVLNHCLTVEAEVTFKGCLMNGGFEAWRRTIQHIHKGRGIRLDRLHDEIRVLHTKSFAKLEDVGLGVVRFDQ